MSPEKALRGLEALEEIDEVVAIIKNGQWYTLEDIHNKAKLPKPKTNKILQFLANYSFIDFDREHKKAKLSSSLTKFLKEDQKG